MAHCIICISYFMSMTCPGSQLNDCQQQPYHPQKMGDVLHCTSILLLVLRCTPRQNFDSYPRAKVALEQAQTDYRLLAKILATAPGPLALPGSDPERLLQAHRGLLSHQKYWTDADPSTISLEEVKSSLDEENEDAGQGNQMERQMIMLHDSLLQFGCP
ncbi:uncharacterized protein F5891DRAFT_581550 [Suillus fuscotomentosus]|uniref:Uncharacterized protein n=1 Tax=Suillus fuscotomentosus TaxID=1912939 RepID=A0AAD4DZ68_9AGAM|nr:uncharacterized protein F5891DRAFT_581550 [Suillus fuscotomentosus]KAG1896662.1 hypothetical protein F5891DRAFT_581550 [Suillus fuscotomentosus]